MLQFLEKVFVYIRIYLGAGYMDIFSRSQNFNLLNGDEISSRMISENNAK